MGLWSLLVLAFIGWAARTPSRTTSGRLSTGPRAGAQGEAPGSGDASGLTGDVVQVLEMFGHSIDGRGSTAFDDTDGNATTAQFNSAQVACGRHCVNSSKVCVTNQCDLLEVIEGRHNIKMTR